MRFVYDLTVPANTLTKAPEQEKVQLVRGVLTNVGIWFRAGPHNQVSVVVLDKILQIVPSAVGTAMIGNDVHYKVPMDYELDDTIHELTLSGCSPDTDYEHKITFFFDVTPLEMSEKNVLQNLVKILVPQGR